MMATSPHAAPANAIGESSRPLPTAVFGWTDAVWPAVSAICVFAFLNLAVDRGDPGLGAYYKSFAAIIRAGFAPAAATRDTITFPMWGYGYLLLLTQNTAVLRWFQFALAGGASIALIKELATTGYLSVREARFANWMLVAALPWHALQLQDYSANSVGASLLLLSLWALVRQQQQEPASRGYWLWAGASGLFFGLMLNVRSDYIYAIAAFIAFLLARRSISWSIRQRAVGAWLSMAFLLLMPWGLFTAQKAGKFMLTSSNSGHVFFIGLGNLPGNKWGISPSDADPVMHAEVRRYFGDNRTTLRPDTDQHLKRIFRQMVFESPGEYMKKNFYVAAMIPLEGFYPGVFDARLKQRIRAQFGNGSPGQILSQHWRDVLSMIDQRSMLMAFSELQGRLYLWVLVAALFTTRVRRKLAASPAMLLMLLLIIYQLAIMVFAYDMRIYLNSQFVPITIIGAMWTAGLGRARGAVAGRAA